LIHFIKRSNDSGVETARETFDVKLWPNMRNSPRKRSGTTSCSTPVEIFSLQQLNRIHVGELRHLAAEKHGIRNATLLKKPDLLVKLKEHFETKHGVELEDEKEGPGTDLSPISQTIDKLRNRIKEKKNNKDAVSDEASETVGSADRLLELAEHVLTIPATAEPQQQVEVVTETVVEDNVQVVEHGASDPAEQPSFDHTDVIGEEVVDNSEETMYEEYITSENVEIAETGEIAQIAEEEHMETVPSTPPPPQTFRARYKVNKVCHGYVVAKTVKELRDLGRDMLRIHAENHGIDYASRLRMPELLKEVIEHYNDVHKAGLEVSKLEMLKLNMLKLKKVKVDVREKTPPPDYSKLVPKNVVPLEEQVHHVYEKRPDVCTVDIIVNNLKDMLALGTSILRPEASKHRVANSSRKQKLQVVEELWEHYLKFHLKDTESSEVVEEEYESDGAFQGYRHDQSGFIVVREEDIVQGEEIQAVAEEITE